MSHRVRILLTSTSVLLVIAVLVMAVLLWRSRTTERSQQQPSAATPNSTDTARTTKRPVRDSSVTRIHAHNLLLRKGPNFRIYVRWLDGVLARTHRERNPSFDNPDSFDLYVQTGVIRVNIGDIGQFLTTSLGKAPLKNLQLSADGPNLKMTGTLHKGIPLQVQVLASVSATTDNRVRIHIQKIDVLKVPVKALLRIFHISPADLISTNIAGMEVKGNDILLDTHTLLPPPHIRGHLTRVSVESPDIEAVYGDAKQDVERAELWRNFFSLNGGTIDFGKITMNTVDIVMIDISKDPWFDLDLVNYREQFANGYTRMTSDSGLQIFIPDRRDIPPKPALNDNIQWFKNRNIPPPPQIVVSTH
jgi:hypothetical protein